MFSFAREEHVRAILHGAGFHEIKLEAVDVPMHGKDIGQSLTFITQAGPLPALLQNGSGEQQAKALAAVREALAAGIGADGRGLHVGLWLASAVA